MSVTEFQIVEQGVPVLNPEDDEEEVSSERESSDFLFVPKGEFRAWEAGRRSKASQCKGEFTGSKSGFLAFPNECCLLISRFPVSLSLLPCSSHPVVLP